MKIEMTDREILVEMLKRASIKHRGPDGGEWRCSDPSEIDDRMVLWEDVWFDFNEDGSLSSIECDS